MKTYTVTIYIENIEGVPKGRVDPYEVKLDLKEKDEVEWILESDYDDASADIARKRGGDDWPFVTEPPKKVKKKDPKKSGPPKAAAKYKNQYNVICTIMDGKKSTEIVIDPDIIIIGGAIE